MCICEHWGSTFKYIAQKDVGLIAFTLTKKTTLRT